VAEEKSSNQNLLDEIQNFLNDLFNLDEDKANEQQIIEDIKKSVVFRGTNLWILMFAIMVCSVGLNVNSTAVIIGAMLISPLMGPIMGVGLGVGINDFELIIKALKNLGIAVIISILVSALYFFISPLNEVTPELEGRTYPTVFDVLIAMFGGLAGIVAGSRSEKSNAIPGVAIATALMPPLCTAGYGIATGNFEYFAGALYLFSINAIFISLSTYLIVRLLRYPKKEFIDPQREKRVRTYILIFALITIIPSIITAINLVGGTIFEQNAKLFIKKEVNFENCQVIKDDYYYSRDSTAIDIILYSLGDPIPAEKIEALKGRLKDYNLQSTNLYVRQNQRIDEKGVDLATVMESQAQLRQEMIENFYKESQEDIKTKDAKIAFLEGELASIRTRLEPVSNTALLKEIKSINPRVDELSFSPTILLNIDSLKQDTLFLAYAKFSRTPRKWELKQLEDWLKARTSVEKLRLVAD